MLLGAEPLGTRSMVAVNILQQTRNISRRRIAYPFYPFKRLTKQNPKKHDTNLKYAMRQFLGPKNYKGEYVMNKYFSVPRNHVPNYIKPNVERGQTLINPITGKTVIQNTNGKFIEIPQQEQYDGRGNNPNFRFNPDKELQPFPSNPHCKTNYIISDELKGEIVNMISNDGFSTQQVSQKLGIKIPRIEAILKLSQIEKKWEAQNRINSNLKEFSNTMFNMFPIFKPEIKRENLSEIPVPEKTLSSRFVTLSESEPFGPVDAAELLELEPAVKTLEQLATTGEHSQGHLEVLQNKKLNNKKRIVLGEVREGDRSVFKFVDSKVGQVGFRYGAGNRDSKKDRKVGFNEAGQMVYI
ncbi:mitochondrial 37S ribosomal protein mS45 NDAI_0D02110 [Naumovozyma dairenensis CBS 421]|uniref:37S ribosomal protein S35, mitochondrial n=1 Tax=Naumovozyma dairenensis (strain ATCC 10597 / BCRC 20456 / CBS 421 / NBRC 0211 / NRRL Y-12639) TaxID=1071378 RepID=G0W9R4_NAUDC|nr:hypothetical protein NDAI_0D02110 [Naumovozyma dairenensis CBS 421]CCD24525.1 hypothetical protein NDAI_0D02110 [Naumovozyma dairenensis CBS 421]